MTELFTWLLGGFELASDRIAVPYVLGALLIAVGVWWLRARRSVSLLKFLFSKALWWHPSARLDYALFVTRMVLDIVWLSSLAISTTAVSFAVARWLWRHVGILPSVEVSPWIIVALFSVSAFVVEDLVRYWVHRAAHRIPALWELHKLHHSAEVLTPLTIFRVHPIEGLLNASSAALAIGIVGGLFNWVVPGKLAAWTIAGTYALSFVWNVLGTNLRHSHVWLSYGQALEHVLISPAQHQVHHSVDPAHFDRNFGSALALWDWLFGTLYITHGRQHLTFGLAAHEHNHQRNVASALLSPPRHALRVLLSPITGATRRERRRLTGA